MVAGSQGFGGKQPTARYSEPKGRIFEQATEFRNVVVLGEDQNGEPVIWSSLDKQQTNELLAKHAMEPTG